MAWQLNFQDKFAKPRIEFIDPPSKHPMYGLSVNYAIDPQSMPSRGRLTQPWKKPVPYVFDIPGLNAASARFKAIVEKFEPGMHQFFPLHVEHCGGAPLGEDLYIFNCAVGIDAIIFRTSKPNWMTYALAPPMLFAGMRESFELSRPAIGDHHIWCGKSVAQTQLFVSDAFYAAVPSGTFEARYREELEEPWNEEEIAPLRQWEARRH